MTCDQVWSRPSSCQGGLPFLAASCRLGPSFFHAAPWWSVKVTVSNRTLGLLAKLPQDILHISHIYINYFQTGIWIHGDKVGRIFPTCFVVVVIVVCLFSVKFQFVNAPYLESNFPSCSWYPLFLEIRPLLFKSNPWTVGKHNLSIIDLKSSVRALQPEKSTEIASSFEDCHLCFSSNLIKPQLLGSSSLNSSLFQYEYIRPFVCPEYHAE